MFNDDGPPPPDPMFPLDIQEEVQDDGTPGHHDAREEAEEDALDNFDIDGDLPDDDEPDEPDEDAPATSSSPGARASTFADYPYEDPGPRRDIIPGVMPAWQVHLFSGASGSGKTTLAAQLLAAIYHGEPFFDWQPRSVPFIGVLAADREWGDHRQWFVEAGIGDVPAHSLVDDETRGLAWVRQFRGKRHMLFRELAKALAQQHCGHDYLPPDSLLLLDPVSLFLGGELNHYDRVFQHMLDMNQFALKYKVTILAIAHAAKQKADKRERYTRPQDRVAGSTAQTACAGTTFHLAPPSECEESWSELTAVPHHAPASTMRLDRGSKGLFIPVPDEQKTRLQDRAQAARMALYDEIATQTTQQQEQGQDLGVTTAQLLQWAATSLSLKRTAVFTHLAQLKEDGLIEPVLGQRGWWRSRKVSEA